MFRREGDRRIEDPISQTLMTIEEILRNVRPGFVLYACRAESGFQGAVKSSPQYPPNIRHVLMEMALHALRKAHDNASGGSPYNLEFSHEVQ